MHGISASSEECNGIWNCQKLSKINKIIADLDVAEKLNKKLVETHQNQKEIYFDSLPGKMKNGDKNIALIAKEEGATLITNDRGCLEGLRSIKQPVLSVEEFFNKPLCPLSGDVTLNFVREF